ncbi:hypothetical protein VA7868_03547 [Vibrio aerogenes CECT 7868]|uniref:Uncharacterized protein n=1 Tax=Vibrio aerogenes CECT 7868 TaxID=1216006 RepID=A0A1M6ADI2_9VIBR|nr:hypothetical protein [Vibrio aerogenes]SHI34482.1 hypothetical protein VA7868_03547 [Vibrio aerogenes CECT 7868]
MRKLLAITLVFFSGFSVAAGPDCYSWPLNMAEVWLKNKGIVDITQLDRTKTQIKQLASETKKSGLYTQVYWFVFHDKQGKTYQVITQSDASDEECSMSDVNTYLISEMEVNH